MAHQPSQSDRAPNEGLTARAEAALTHPATLLALATLLVNDLVFKSFWPGTWLTGKLSDLAWIVFAPPLLALLLTFLARRDSTAQKAVWVIAYIGLPLRFDWCVLLEFHGATITSDAGLLACRELDDALGMAMELDDSGWTFSSDETPD